MVCRRHSGLFCGVLSDGTPESARQAFFPIGIFMSGWIILYGAVQASAPRLLARQTGSLPQTIRSNRRWVAVLTAILVVLTLAAILEVPALAAIIVVGLLVSGGVFALNSALHSYLILAFAKSERVTVDVGFYCMSNAGGRLVGTLLSGLCHQLWDVAGWRQSCRLSAFVRPDGWRGEVQSPRRQAFPIDAE